MGVANDRSIAWGIAKAISKEGGKIAFTYQGDSLKKKSRAISTKYRFRYSYSM